LLEDESPSPKGAGLFLFPDSRPEKIRALLPNRHLRRHFFSSGGNVALEAIRHFRATLAGAFPKPPHADIFF